ncbi:amidohydrolase [Streptomyces microflavus]|uniref:amidohydrolase n=1 Tax=Streptomyces microflavus TaxID=1919 RepID=UPI0033E1773B
MSGNQQESASRDKPAGWVTTLDPALQQELESLYKDLHAHPELSFAEDRTAGIVADRLTELGLEVHTGIGGTGVAAVLRNGGGPVIAVRADMDALPVREQTGLPYASTATGTGADGEQVPVAHACGHDMHVTCQLGALELLAAHTDAWSGTVVAIFQPAEEVGSGAKSMIDDGLYDKVPQPSIVLAQHVMPLPAGTITYRCGAFGAATDALRVQLFGKGGHGSMPEATIDPVVMAAATVMRLQTVRSREIAGNVAAVVTVGAMNAGTKDNVIPDTAELRLNLRTYNIEDRTHVLDGVHRIINAEAKASNAPKDPEISVIDSFPVLHSDPEATATTADALRKTFGADKVVEAPAPGMASEDAGDLATAINVPIVYWAFGGTDPKAYAAAASKGTVAQDIPSNHNPKFAPVVEPTLQVGVTAMITGALAWLGSGSA